MLYKQPLDVRFALSVAFTRDVFHVHNPVLSGLWPHGSDRAVVFLDSGLAQKQPELSERIHAWFRTVADRITLAAPVQIVPGGEAIKNSFDIVAHVGGVVFDAGLCRHGCILIVGGGAVLDAVGFAASIVHRGIRHIRVPTTVLSQNDSGVGVKNGINGLGVKNFYGCFQPPEGVVIDTHFLRTLDDRHWRGGAAEAFKVAIIKDREFLDELIRHAPDIRARDEAFMDRLIHRCARLHLDHIAGGGDPFERGVERPLDFGHWVSHWLETATGHELSHGESVAVGVAVDLHIAAGRGLLGRTVVESILAAMRCAGLPLWHPQLQKRAKDGRLAVMEGLEQFRQHLGGRLTLAMPDGPGRSCNLHRVGTQDVEDAIASLETLPR